jgi:hypothetical protein
MQKNKQMKVSDLDMATYCESLLDVSGDEVVVAILTSRAFRYGSLRRKFRQAFHSRDVVVLLGCRKS